MDKPLDRAFNVAVLHMASRLFPKGFDVAAEAPSTLEELSDHVAKTGRMLVWSGASENTIFADAEVNYAFRAWHDWQHLTYQFPFTLEGEKAAAACQIADIAAIFGQSAAVKRFARLIWCEVVGQAEYKERTGEFPTDQVDFARNWLATN